MIRIAAVVAEFNRAVVDPMVDAARDEAERAGAVLAREVRVPGSFELPLIADALLRKRKVDACLAIGYIEKGETLHGEVLGHVVYRALVELQLQHGKPIGLAIIGPGATHAQAAARVDGHARAAVRAVVASLGALRRLRA
jgi:6,7-dimethyl-8-ribityllumazine synthase